MAVIKSFVLPVLAVVSLVFGGVAINSFFTSGAPPGLDAAATTQTGSFADSARGTFATTPAFVPIAVAMAFLAGIALFALTYARRSEEEDILQAANSPPSYNSTSSRFTQAWLALKRAAGICLAASLVAAA